MKFANIVGFSVALAFAATSAHAQGRGNGKEHHGNPHGTVVRTANGDVMVVPGNGRQIPPGLAKKPGQMPPGQYKKYNPAQGASTLSDIFRRHGYTVERTVPSGNSRYVYYRLPNGTVQRAIVSPGTSQLSFGNVPSSILREVLSRLY